jgi:hypothetical protein
MRTLQTTHAAQIVGSQPPPGSPPSPAGVIEVPESGWVAQALFVAGRPRGMRLSTAGLGCDREPIPGLASGSCSRPAKAVFVKRRRTRVAGQRAASSGVR